VEELARYRRAVRGAGGSSLAAAKAAVEDVSAGVRDFAEKVHASPERLEEIEDRLAALDRLKRKYGGAGGSRTLAEVMRFGEEAARRLAEVENRDELLAELRVQQERDAAGVSRGGE
jgi:DNA repair protein RecN (Recombination protein N)